MLTFLGFIFELFAYFLVDEGLFSRPVCPWAPSSSAWSSVTSFWGRSQQEGVSKVPDLLSFVCLGYIFLSRSKQFLKHLQTSFFLENR